MIEFTKQTFSLFMCASVIASGCDIRCQHPEQITDNTTDSPIVPTVDGGGE